MAKTSIPAGAPKDPAAIVALVRQQTVHEWEDGGLPPDLLDRCVHDAVAAVTDGRVGTFTAVLALRRVRGCIRAGTCDGEDF